MNAISMLEPSLSPKTQNQASLNGEAGFRSLEGLNATVSLPPASAGFWRQLRAFAGPAFLVSVGYMDPGNWGSDLQAGAQYRYGLLWVVALSSLMAIVMQVIAARLGVVTGKDLAQACRDFYWPWTRWPLWIFCEVAIGACDLAEVLGSAVAINLLFHIPLFWAVLITAFDVLLLLALQGLGMRFIEAVILLLVATIGGCYLIEIFVLPQTQPSFLEMGQALVSPGFREQGMIVVAIAIIGATVMPHNLYLHSALVHSRKLRSDEPAIRRAIKFNTIDTVLALSVVALESDSGGGNLAPKRGRRGAGAEAVHAVSKRRPSAGQARNRLAAHGGHARVCLGKTWQTVLPTARISRPYQRREPGSRPRRRHACRGGCICC